ncbi:hypothetical protein [Paramicrobacterium agarici]|uniref:Very-short-patch-repair endonuclease n=1 Tax=Paramicrobacterium agarici TaxID=630514 RepID=A0A2A9E134_9MICO|nr:hypothetical protein [Microbacterium agarici]PFG31922.1 hypothetical protein ATJ78_2905 [Microbacterium agarici]
MDILALMSSLGEVARTPRLREKGVSRSQMDAALASGSLIRVKRGWVATHAADAEQLAVVRHGGRLGCISALARWGLWAADDRAPHIAMGRRGHAAALRFDLGTTTEAVRHPDAIDSASPRPMLRRPARHHWTTVDQNDLDWIVSPVDALRQAVHCQPLEHAVACVDSALHHGIVSRPEWANIAKTVPLNRGPVARLVDSSADSGLESRIRVRLVLLGHDVKIQVPLAGFGNLDMVIDDCVGLELDGDRFHADAVQRRRDTAKVVVAHSKRLPVLRVGYAQAIHEWETVYEAVTHLIELARGTQFRKSA